MASDVRLETLIDVAENLEWQGTRPSHSDIRDALNEAARAVRALLVPSQPPERHAFVASACRCVSCVTVCMRRTQGGGGCYKPPEWHDLTKEGVGAPIDVGATVEASQPTAPTPTEVRTERHAFVENCNVGNGLCYRFIGDPPQLCGKPKPFHDLTKEGVGAPIDVGATVESSNSSAPTPTEVAHEPRPDDRCALPGCIQPARELHYPWRHKFVEPGPRR